MSLNEFLLRHTAIDRRTGRISAISGASVSPDIRSACCALNRQRTRAIHEASHEPAPRKSSAAHVWKESVAGRLEEWALPLVSLERLGVSVDREGFLSGIDLEPLPAGAEASPFLDVEGQVVYKLFDLKSSGFLGKKLILERDERGIYYLELASADLLHTLTKLSLLNEMGAHPTEIVGIADSGNYLVAKQPLAFHTTEFEADREIATDHMRAFTPARCHFRQKAVLGWINEEPWFEADLHERNIMRDVNGDPTVIDALAGSIPPSAIREIEWLRESINQAAVYRDTGEKPRDRFMEDTDDSEL